MAGWFTRAMLDDDTDGTYGENVAKVYDDMFLVPFAPDTAAAVEFLRGLAGDGPALELGVGTGRVALPLVRSGVEVHGIDSSEPMIRILRKKPGGESLPVTMGTFARFDLDRRFPLIYVVFNTFFSLLTQDEQVSCFESVATHLAPGGAFVMQAFVPDVTRFDVHNQRVSVESLSADELTLDASTHDAAEQRTDNLHVVVQDGKVELYPVKIRYAYVSELDLMARIAGLKLRERWAGWDRTPYPSPRWMHISVWERPA